MPWCKQCDSQQVCLNCDDKGATPYKCNVAQNYCGAQAETAAENGWVPPSVSLVSVDQSVITAFPRSALNSLIDAINELSSWSSGPDGEGPGSRSSYGGTMSGETREFLYADKLKEMADLLYNISSSNSYTPPTKDISIVTAESINDLISAVKNAKLSSSACPQCVSSCNIACNSCNNCNNCQSCNDCQDQCQYQCEFCDVCDTWEEIGD